MYKDRRKADAESFGVGCLLFGTKWTRSRCKSDGIRRLCTIRPEKTNDGLIVVLRRQLLVFGYSNEASFHSREAGIG